MACPLQRETPDDQGQSSESVRAQEDRPESVTAMTRMRPRGGPCKHPRGGTRAPREPASRPVETVQPAGDRGIVFLLVGNGAPPTNHQEGRMTNETDSFYFDHIRNDIHLDLIDRDDGEAFVSEESAGGLEFLRDETAGDEGWRPF